MAQKKRSNPQKRLMKKKQKLNRVRKAEKLKKIRFRKFPVPIKAVITTKVDVSDLIPIEDIIGADLQRRHEEHAILFRKLQ